MLRFAGIANSAAFHGASFGNASFQSSLTPSRWLSWYVTIEGKIIVPYRPPIPETLLATADEVIQ
jgi:hypothetical protein